MRYYETNRFMFDNIVKTFRPMRRWIANTLEANDVGPEREERVIHQLIKDSPELQSLRAKLQIAEISRQRHQQVYISQWILMLKTTRVDSEIL